MSDRGAGHGRQPGGRSGAVHGQAPTPRLRVAGRRSRASRSIAKLKVPSEFTQSRVLVYGQNNVNVWSRRSTSLAVAVTEECPYSIEIVEPKVPLVRGGSMGLKVRAIRKPGFKAADLGVPALESARRWLGAAASRSPKGRTRRSSR